MRTDRDHVFRVSDTGHVPTAQVAVALFCIVQSFSQVCDLGHVPTVQVAVERFPIDWIVW